MLAPLSRSSSVEEYKILKILTNIAADRPRGNSQGALLGKHLLSCGIIGNTLGFGPKVPDSSSGGSTNEASKTSYSGDSLIGRTLSAHHSEVQVRVRESCKCPSVRIGLGDWPQPSLYRFKSCLGLLKKNDFLSLRFSKSVYIISQESSLTYWKRS